jgi:tetratricopeptide (TPR) repeat protein
MMLTVYGRKSQIAIEYAYRFRDQHPQGHVLWVYAANETRFTQAYRDVARKVQLPGWEDPQVDGCKLVCEWLDEMEDVPWLMILDNADNAANFLSTEDGMAERSANSVFMAGYLPTKFNHSKCLLITTRSRDVGEYLSQGQVCVNVGPLSIQEAGDLLRAKVRVFRPSHTPEADKLAEILGRIPLAITQAAAFINRNKISIAEYVDELAIDKQSFIAYLSEDLQDPRREPGFPNSIFRTWKLSFDQIQINYPRAAEVLSLMAMLDGQKIPEDLVRKEDERRIDFSTAIGTLDGYSMITKDVGDKTCTIHPLVQLAVQYILEQSGRSVFYMGQALQLISVRFPAGKHENKVICESLLPHARAVLQHDMGLDAMASSRGRLSYNVGWFEWRQGRYESAYQDAQTAYQICQEIFGDEAKNTLNSLALLVPVLQFQGKYEAAEEMNQRVLAGREKALGVEHPDTLTSVSNLAAILQHQGKYEAAEEMNRRALAGYEKVLGVEHPDTLTSVSNLASVLRYQGKYEAAEEMNRWALAGNEKVLGVEHPDTLTSVSSLASVLQNQGKYEAAEEMNRRALAGREKILGIEHPDMLISVSCLASVLQDQGKYEAAEEMNRRALAGREKVLGIEHPHTLTSVSRLASVLQDQGKYEVAEEMNRRALAGYEKVLGAEHPDTLTSVGNLASVLRGQGKYEAAEEMNRRALAGREKVLSVEHPDTLTSVGNLALVLQHRGKYEAAEEMNRRALAGREKVLGIEHPHTLTSVYNLARLFGSQNRFEPASTLYQRALSGYRQTLGPTHPTTLACARHYASLPQEMEIDRY